jgi:hypothetical protein
VVSSGTFTDSVVEEAALAWLESAGRLTRNGAEIAAGRLQAKEAESAIKETTT